MNVHVHFMCAYVCVRARVHACVRVCMCANKKHSKHHQYMLFAIVSANLYVDFSDCTDKLY